MDNVKFAGFIITFNRNDILLSTINTVLAQSLSPEKLLIIDNSPNSNCFNTVLALDDDRLIYHSMGYNAGPAGAAKYGLNFLSENGYDYIYWGDDNDPPLTPDVFSSLISYAVEHENVGVIGTSGGFFNSYFVKTTSLRNREVNGFTDVDYVPGCHNLIVSSRCIKSGAEPNESLFFGFEELEFCLKVSSLGFRIVVDGAYLLNLRRKTGNSSKNYRDRGSSFGDFNRLNRNYYSLRNLLYILYSNNFYFGFIFLIFKNIVKVLFALFFGFLYFKYNLVVIFSAIKDFVTGSMGFNSRFSKLVSKE